VPLRKVAAGSSRPEALVLVQGVDRVWGEEDEHAVRRLGLAIEDAATENRCGTALWKRDVKFELFNNLIRVPEAFRAADEQGAGELGVGVKKDKEFSRSVGSGELGERLRPKILKIIVKTIGVRAFAKQVFPVRPESFQAGVGFLGHTLRRRESSRICDGGFVRLSEFFVYLSEMVRDDGILRDFPRGAYV
jgi:hypothetical protein